MDAQCEGKIQEGPVPIVGTGNNGYFEFGKDMGKGITHSNIVVGLEGRSPWVECRSESDVRNPVKISRGATGEPVSSSDRDWKDDKAGRDEVHDLNAPANKERPCDKGVPIHSSSPSLAKIIGWVGTCHNPRYILSKEVWKDISRCGL